VVSEKKFPASVIKTFTLLAIRGPQKILWYQLFDPYKRNRGDSEDFFGLIRSRRDYTSKGAEAFRLCAAFLSGATYYPQYPLRENIPGSLQSFYFEGSGGVLILWNDGLFPAQVQISLGGTACLRHDPFSGAAEEIPPETVIRVGATPVFITWQPGAAAPCVIRKPR
jgi:hypothetical protein